MAERRNTATPVVRASRSRVHWTTIARTALGVALLLGLLLWNDNAEKLLHLARNFEAQYVLALLAIAIGLSAIASLKWSLFIRQEGVTISQSRLFGLYLIGKFFNNFLPSNIGGDVARIYLLGRLMRSQSRSFASVFLERATGVIGLTATAAGFGVANSALLTSPIIGLTIAIAVLGCAVMVVFFYRPPLLFGLLDLVAGMPVLGKLAGKAKSAIRDVTYFRDKHRLLLLSLLYSFGFHLLTGLNVYTACLSIGLVPDLLDVLVITPVILLLVMVPVSPNNIGWWEWCFSVLLVDAGATAAEGLAVALTLRAVAMALSLVGGILFLQQRFGPATS